MRKDISNEEDATKAEKRPKLQSIDGNPDLPTSTPKIRRIAQPGDVLFPRVVAYRTDLKPTSKLVAMWLYDHLQPGTNLANGSQDLIAEELGLTRRTVIKALDELWDNRIITKIERINKKGGGFYLCYGMQMFPSDSPRVKQRPRKQRVKQFGLHKKVQDVKSNQQQPNQAEQSCTKCLGSGWERLPERKGVRRCDCAK
jgi:predicted transcriptional regulator